jgi:hypothetical protein
MMPRLFADALYSIGMAVDHGLFTAFPKPLPCILVLVLFQWWWMALSNMLNA